MPTYELIQGDCLEVMRGLADKSIDCVVTDPPYGIANLNRFGSRDNITAATNYKPIIGDDQDFDPAPFLAYPVVVLFGANWYAPRLPASGGWIVWDKKDGGTSDNFSDGEMAWVKGSNTLRIIHHKWRGMIRASEQKDPRLHSTQKPVWVMSWILENYTKPGDTILDPFMGSGTTGVAALKTGRNFIGVEISEEYFKVAEKRIREAQAQLPIPFAPTYESDGNSRTEAQYYQDSLPSL